MIIFFIGVFAVLGWVLFGIEFKFHRDTKNLLNTTLKSYASCADAYSELGVKFQRSCDVMSALLDDLRRAGVGLSENSKNKFKAFTGAKP